MRKKRSRYYIFRCSNLQHNTRKGQDDEDRGKMIGQKRGLSKKRNFPMTKTGNRKAPINLLKTTH